MKLTSLYEDGYWKVLKSHPGKLGGSGQKGKSDYSFLIQPSDTKKFRNWGFKKQTGKHK